MSSEASGDSAAPGKDNTDEDSSAGFSEDSGANGHSRVACTCLVTAKAVSHFPNPRRRIRRCRSKPPPDVFVMNADSDSDEQIANHKDLEMHYKFDGENE